MKAVAVVLALALEVAGCGASGHPLTTMTPPPPVSHPPHGGAGIVGLGGAFGSVGALELGVSSATAVQRFAGKADFIGVGTFEVPGDPEFLALGYDCTKRRSLRRIDPTAYRPSHTYCRTVYYISDKTRKLAAFWTSSAAFKTRYGTHPGSSQAYANRNEDALPEFGCRQGLGRDTAVASLFIPNRGGHPRTKTLNGLGYTTAIIGGFVNDLELEATTGRVGLLFC